VSKELNMDSITLLHLLLSFKVTIQYIIIKWVHVEFLIQWSKGVKVRKILTDISELQFETVIDIEGNGEDRSNGRTILDPEMLNG